MAYITAEARVALLGEIALAIDQIADAIAALGAAYELLDDHGADRLESELFLPAQSAYGKAKRTHDEFAARHDLPTRRFVPADPGHPSQGLRGFVDDAVARMSLASHTLSALQDSMAPVEVGDAELRAGLAEVRSMLGVVPERARTFVRTIGR